MDYLIDLLSHYSELLVGISTLALVIITAYYAYQTRCLTKQAILQREDGTLPIIIAEGFTMKDSDKQPYYCVTCRLKNIGNGPALSIMVSFLDGDSKVFITKSKHHIDFLEKGFTEDAHIHIDKKDFENIRYRETDKGRLVGALAGKISFHDFHGNRYTSQQQFSFIKEILEISPVRGTFRFINEGE